MDLLIEAIEEKEKMAEGNWFMNKNLVNISTIIKIKYPPFTKRKSAVHKSEFKKNNCQQILND